MSQNEDSEMQIRNVLSQDTPDVRNSDNALYSHDNNFTSEKVELTEQPLDSDELYDFGFYYDQIREYDVREKLQTLNAKLASEPLPPEPEYRNSRVGFKDEIESLVAPTNYYELSESDLDDTSYNINNTDLNAFTDHSDSTLPSDNYLTPQVSPDSSSSTVQITKYLEENELSNHNGQSNSFTFKAAKILTAEAEMSEKGVVVSRGGTFQFLSADDITDGSKHISKKENYNLTKGNNDKHIKKRPISAPAPKRNVDNGLNFDSGSFSHSDPNSRSSSTLGRPNDRTKFQIPRVDKEALCRQQERRKRQEEENRRLSGEKQSTRKEVNEKSFNAWLQIKQKQKKEEDEKRKKAEADDLERKQRQKEERKNLATEMETELTKKIAQEKRKEEKMRQYKLKEIEESMIIHSESERQKAYKDWLKKKHDDHVMKIREEKQNARITRLAMRQCRKSQNLAQAIQQSRFLNLCEYP